MLASTMGKIARTKAMVRPSCLVLLAFVHLASAFVVQPLRRSDNSRVVSPPRTSFVQTRSTGWIRSMSMSDGPSAADEGGMPSSLPDDPSELARMEREYYNDQPELKRLKLLRKQLEDLPKQRQCHRYRWTQTETTFDVEIPMHKPCEDKDLYLVVEKDQMQVAVRTDEAFGAITGVFPGDVDASACSFRIHNRHNEPYIHVEIVKMTSAGMYEFWHELLQGEVESPTIRFAGSTKRYRWKQNAETIEVEIDVPSDVTKRKTKLDLNPAGTEMHLSFAGRPDFKPLEGKFKGHISPLDSVWMFDESDDGKMLALTIKKRRGAKDTTEWWSGVLEGDDKW